MMWNEFVAGTQCRETDHNEEVFKRVEALYMADEAMTKEEAYTIAKMWIDNSLTEEEETHNAKISETIEAQREILEQYEGWAKECRERSRSYRERAKEEKEEAEQWKRAADEVRAKIAELEAGFITA